MVSQLRIICLPQGVHKKTDLLRVGIHKLEERKRPAKLTSHHNKMGAHTTGVEQGMKGYFQWTFMDDWSGKDTT